MFGNKILKDEVANLTKKVSHQQRRIECIESGGHNWVYDRYRDGYLNRSFIFACSKCGDERSFSEGKLSPERLKALQSLGLIETKEQKEK